jgi:invasion protein IalB
LVFENGTIGKLKSGKVLHIAVFAEGAARPVSLSVSLKGFAAALNRVADLTK